MASVTQTLALMQNALKVIFGKSLHKDIVDDHEFMSLFQAEMNIKTEDTTGGRYVEQGHWKTLPAGAGWRADGEYLPEAGVASFMNSRLYLRKMLFTLQMSGDTMRRVQSDEGAFLDYMEEAKPALIERVNSQLDLAYIGTGAGIKARIGSSVTDNHDGTYTFVVEHHSGVTGYTDAWLAFLEGENIVFSSTAAFTALRNAGTGQYAVVTALDEDASTVTVSCNGALGSAIAKGDYIAEGDGAGYGAFDTSGNPRSLAGVLAGDDDGGIVEVYNNIDRSDKTNRLWRSIVIDAVAEGYPNGLTEDLLDLAMRRGLIRGAAKTSAILTSHSQTTRYWRSLKGDQRFVNPQGNFAGGKGKLKIIIGDSTYDLRVARKLPPEVCFGIQADTWARLTLGELTWDDLTGSIWKQVTDSTGVKDEFRANGFLYEQLYCFAPRRNWRLDGLAPAETPVGS
jgi:hypothetical protein